MIVLKAELEDSVVDRRWPTAQELLDLARRGMLDETPGTVRPDPETRRAFRAEIAALKKQRKAVQKQHEPSRPA